MDLNKIIMNFNTEQKHLINKKLTYQICNIAEGHRQEIKEIHSQYHSLIKQFYVPFDCNTTFENIEISMDKAYNKMKLDYKNE